MGGTGGGHVYAGYPVAGTVYRDATMNPQYPVRTPAAFAPYNSGTAYGGTAGIPGRVGGNTGPWTTNVGTAAVHQPRPATTSTTRRPTITTAPAAAGDPQSERR